MSRLIGFLLVMLALGAQSALAEIGILLGDTFGGPHGKKYSDQELVTPGQRVRAVTVRSKERVDAVSLVITNEVGTDVTVSHDGDGGQMETRTLGFGKYITGMEVHWGKNRGGTQADNVGKDTAPEGYQLEGFVGSSGNELDSMGAIWTKCDFQKLKS